MPYRIGKIFLRDDFVIRLICDDSVIRSICGNCVIWSIYESQNHKSHKFALRLKNEDTCCRRQSSKLALGCNPGAQVPAVGDQLKEYKNISSGKISCEVTDEQLESILTRENNGGGL